MKRENLIAKAEVHIDAPAESVWDALVNPKIVEKYMMGAKVVSDWKEGSEIKWKGEFKGKKYEDKGTILEIEPKKTLKYTHFSPMSGQLDAPENYHTVIIKLKDENKSTSLSLTQDKNTTEKEKEESAKNWETMLGSLKKIVEKN